MNDSSQILVFDRALLRVRRNRAAAGFAAHGALLEESAAQLIDRLGDIKQAFQAALDLGAHNGLLARHLGERKIPFVVAADLSERMIGYAPVPKLVADEEWLPFTPGSFDLIASNLSLHWVNDLPGALAQIRHALKPNGLFLAALIGGESLYELRHCLMEAELAMTGGVSPRISPAIDLPTASALLQRGGFSLPVADSEKIILHYADMFALMRDLRGMGASNPLLNRLRHPTQRRVFHEAARLYAERFPAEDGGISATFEIVFLHGVRG